MRRFQFLRLPVCLVLVAVLASPAMSQDERPDRRGGGRGGPGGGPGGPGGFGGGRGGDPTLGLLMIPEVRKEIEVMPDQEEALTKIREQAASSFERPNFDFGSASEEERTKMFQEMQAKRSKAEKEIRDKLEEVLLPEQFERLSEISLQVRGTAALSDPETAEKLKISADQKSKLDEVRTKNESGMRDKMREIFSSGNRDNMREEFAKVRKEMDDQMLAVLTDDQRKQFEEMKGEAFTMPEGGLGGRGGFGGPGGDGGRRPGGDGGGRPDGDGGGRPDGDGGRPGGDRPRTRPASE